MNSLCGINCEECDFFKSSTCKGCIESKACPFSKKCFIADYIEIGGKEKYEKYKQKLIKEFNSLNIEGMPKINELYPLNGAFVNLEYSLPNGEKVKLLDDNEIYLGNQVECEFIDSGKCYGLLANMYFLLVCEYEENGTNPEIVVYRRR